MSAIRMTGLISGLDTESIIKELVNAQKLKNKKTSDKLTLSEWKEDKWKELNAKLFKLYTDDLSNMRLQGSYAVKKTSTSNEDLVEVTGNSTAPEGAHTLTIDQLASSQYVTGGKLDTDLNGKAITTSTKLKDLGMAVGTTINVSSGGNEKSLLITDKTTLNDFISTCKSAGLNASYDTTQKRLFISSGSSGLSNAFTITTDATALNDINNLVDYNSLDTADQNAVSDALAALQGTASGDLSALYTKAKDGIAGADADEQKKIDAINTLRNYTIDEAKDDLMADCIANVKNTTVTAAVLADYDDGTNDAAAQKTLAIKDEIKAQVQAKIDEGKLTLDDTETVESYSENLYNTYSEDDRDIIFSQVVDKKYASDTVYADEAIADYNAAIAAGTYADNALEGPDGLLNKLTSYLDNSTGDISALGLSEVTGTAVTAGSPGEMTVVAASDAKITLDGAELTGSSNSMIVNGLTINLKGETAAGETITLDVSNNTQATYDMVKDFIKSYNEILKEMNTLYYADSARGYDPLSDDEKEAMTDDQIEKWETKIKDSVLRRDSSLGAVIDSMKTTMMGSVTVDGKKYSLSTFGIQTSTDYTEKGLLHIYGNKEDSTYSDKDDKLMKALTEDPDAAIEALSGIFGDLYDTMNDKMSSIPNVRSIYTFYNDKLMDKEQTDYKKRVAVLEDKLSDMEDKYYKQFSAMETALAKLQSQSNALAGLLGNSSNQ